MRHWSFRGERAALSVNPGPAGASSWAAKRTMVEMLLDPLIHLQRR